MRPYEVMVILDPGVEEEVLRGVVDRGVELLRSKGANPGRVDHWGKRRMAYEMRHKPEGYYVLIEVTGEPAALADLDRMFSLADEVMRHKIIRLPDSAAARSRSAPVAAEPSADAGAREPSANGA